MMQAELARQDEFQRRSEEKPLSQKMLDEQRVGRLRARWLDLHNEIIDFKYEAERNRKIRIHAQVNWDVDPADTPTISINIISRVDQSLIYGEKLPAEVFPLRSASGDPCTTRGVGMLMLDRLKHEIKKFPAYQLDWQYDMHNETLWVRLAHVNGKSITKGMTSEEMHYPMLTKDDPLSPLGKLATDLYNAVLLDVLGQ